MSSSGDMFASRSGFSVRKSKSRSRRAGLLFPVGRIHRMCRKDPWVGFRIGKGAPVYLAAVLEYLVAEIAEQAGLVARLGGKDRIVPRHIKLAVRRDEELDILLTGVIMQGVGTMETKETVVLETADMAGDLRQPTSRKKEKNLKRDKTAKKKSRPKSMIVGDSRPDMSVDLPRNNNFESDLVIDLTGEGFPVFEKDQLGIENEISKELETCRDKENNNSLDVDHRRKPKSSSRDKLKMQSLEKEMSRIGQHLEKVHEKEQDLNRNGVNSKRDQINTDKSHGLTQDKNGRRSIHSNMGNVQDLTGMHGNLDKNITKRGTLDKNMIPGNKHDLKAKKERPRQFLEIQNQDDFHHVKEFFKLMKGVRKEGRNTQLSRSSGI